MARFPDIETLVVAEIGPVIFRPTYRGKLNLPSLMYAAYRILVADKDADLAFLTCPPGLVRHFRKFGARPYGGQLIDVEGHTQIPLVLILSDYDHLKRVGSIFLPLARKHFAGGHKKTLDTTRFRSIMEEGVVEIDPEKVWQEVHSQFIDIVTRPTLIEALPEKALKTMVEAGFLLDVSEGDIVVHEGARERELYLIIDGVFEIFEKSRPFLLLEKGDLFGEIAFFTESGQRSASVRALSKGKVLVFHREFLKKLTRTDPEAAYQIFMNMGRIMAERLAATTHSVLSTLELPPLDIS